MNKKWIFFCISIVFIGCDFTNSDSSKKIDSLKSDEKKSSTSQEKSVAEIETDVKQTLAPSGDLEIIYTNGCGSKVVDYRGCDFNRIDEMDHDGVLADSYFINGCDGGSISPKVLRASSTLDQDKILYQIKNLTDYNPKTAWVEGVKGYGIGSFFEIYCNNLNTIFNGYQNSPENWMQNSRVKKFKIYLDDKPLCYLLLKDEMGEQNFELPFTANWDKGHVFRFEIVEVYEGTKYSDVCISEIGVQGCCFDIASSVYGISETKSFLQCNDTIHSINLETNSIEPVVIQEIVHKKKSKMYEITVGQNRILATREHKFIVENCGNLSIMEMLSLWNLDSYFQLCNLKDLRIAIYKSDEIIYEPISFIKIIDGDFNTQSIRKLSNGSHFIVNGFLQKVELPN